MRSRKRQSEQQLADEREEGLPPGVLAADGPTPERLAYSGQVQKKVAVAMSRLTPVERAAFVLRHFEGSSIEEIARALDLRTSAAKNAVYRAVEKLRAALEPVVSSTR